MPPAYGKFGIMFGSLRCESWKKLSSLVFWVRLPYLSTSHPSDTECMLNGRNGAHALYMIIRVGWVGEWRSRHPVSHDVSTLRGPFQPCLAAVFLGVLLPVRGHLEMLGRRHDHRVFRVGRDVELIRTTQCGR